MEKQEIIVRLAKVTEIGADGQAKVTFYGDTEPSGKKYPYIRNYVPKIGDTAVLLKQGDSYIIIGAAILSEVVIEYAAVDHNHDEKYAPADQKFTCLYSENEKYGARVTDGGYLVPLSSESLGLDSCPWAKVYGNTLFALSKIVIGNTSVTENFLEKLQSPTTLQSNSVAARKVIFSASALLPDTSGAVSLGSSSKRYREGHFDNVYINGTAVSTSDKRKKKFIKNLPDRFVNFFMKLRPVMFKYKDGTSGRSHAGFVAQEVEQAMIEGGVTSEEFGGLVIQPNGKYGLRYEEFISIQTKVIQDLYQRVENLERTVKEIEKRDQCTPECK